MAKDELLGLVDVVALDVEDPELPDQILRELRESLPETFLRDFSRFLLADEG